MTRNWIAAAAKMANSRAANTIVVPGRTAEG